MCAAILDRRDTVPAPPFSTAVNSVIGYRPLSGRMRLAPLRLSPTGDRWLHDDVELKIINHAKFWMVDERAFHVGSDNLYPHNLQEFGFVIESAAVAREALTAYWEPLWMYSSRTAIDVCP